MIISDVLSACDVSPSAIQGLARISNWVGQSGGEKEAENTEKILVGIQSAVFKVT